MSLTANTDTFVCLPLKALQSTPGVASCIIGALLNAAYEANGAVDGRILFLLDEAFRLGRMNIIETAREAGRKYGITLQLLYQSVGQIIDQWGLGGKRAWYESASWRSYAGVKDAETAARAVGDARQLRRARLVGSAERRQPWPAVRRALPLARMECNLFRKQRGR